MIQRDGACEISFESLDEITITVPEGSVYLIDGEEVTGPASITKKTTGGVIKCVALRANNETEIK